MPVLIVQSTGNRASGLFFGNKDITYDVVVSADMENDITSVEFQPDGQIVRSFAVSG